MAEQSETTSETSSRLSYARVEETASETGLIVMGALHPRVTQAKHPEGGTLVLLGAGDAFWPALKASPEWLDQHPDPVDRWSSRVIGDMASDLGAQAHFPFGGPPYAPFIDWALKSGRTFSSPVGALVHDTVGMMISFRGALHFPSEFDVPEASAPSPCITCDAPCTSTCPVGALNAESFYNVDACHRYLSTAAGQICMTGGCAVRLACPLSKGAGRRAEQSSHHMRAFHPT
ncbi:ferredoxin [Ruegeria sp. EL01]|jgi:ferredoxin|uniref:ferredoxin n=1 Tax=Ruegeria sp. EL01 TaxID=2107578 RepID=UPI0013C3FC25|nr:ferredoxin [Ruegeria sp. EL01]